MVARALPRGVLGGADPVTPRQVQSPDFSAPIAEEIAERGCTRAGDGDEKVARNREEGVEAATRRSSYPRSDPHPHQIVPTGMKYILLIHEPAANFEARHQGEGGAYISAWRTYYQALVQAGVYVDGAPLKESSTGTTVRVRDDKRQVQDGPYADTKEQLGGFILLELPSLDAALEWAARCPAARSGAVEVRPMDVECHTTIQDV